MNKGAQPTSKELDSLTLLESRRLALINRASQNTMAGGLKGLLEWTGTTCYNFGITVRNHGTTASRFLYKYGGSIAFALATTSMITLMPLVFEAEREARVRMITVCSTKN